MIHLVQDANFQPTIYSPDLATAIANCGMPSDFVPLGRRWNPHCCRTATAIPKLQDLYAILQTRPFARKALRHMAAGDIAVVYESAPLTSHWLDGWFQRALVRKGVRYLPVFPDAWPVTDGCLRPCCHRRIALATAVGCVTPGLVDLFRSIFPDKRVVLLEEPLPSGRFSPNWSEKGCPTVCWSGPPTKIDEVVRMLPVLESVARASAFRLRIVSGTERPALETDLPFEWMPFDDNDYRSGFEGADIAFAHYDDSPFGACKGNYKVKNYMAAGCAIVTSPVGYNLELIQPGVNGLFANTPEEWRTAFLRLLRNPKERLNMRKAARESAVRRFAHPAIARQYAGILRQLAAEPSALSE